MNKKLFILTLILILALQSLAFGSASEQKQDLTSIDLSALTESEFSSLKAQLTITTIIAQSGKSKPVGTFKPLDLDFSDYTYEELSAFLERINGNLFKGNKEYVRGLTPNTLNLESGSVRTVQESVDGIVTMLVTITPRLTNKATVEQCLYDIKKLVDEYRFADYETLEYTAEIEYLNKKTNKINTYMAVQFKVDHTVLGWLRDDVIHATELLDYVDDLLIHQTLQ